MDSGLARDHCRGVAHVGYEEVPPELNDDGEGGASAGAERGEHVVEGGEGGGQGALEVCEPGLKLGGVLGWGVEG